MLIQDTFTGKFRQSLVNDPEFVNAVCNIQSGVDFDNSYDIVCQKANCASFVMDDAAWNLFFDTYCEVNS